MIRGGFYGRRYGRPLGSKRKQLLKEILPEISISVPNNQYINLSEYFSSSSPEVWLEIGFGSGEHLAWQAEKNPNISFLACDLYINGIASLLRYIEEKQFNDIKIAQIEASHLLKLLPDKSISKVFILFPDPWPKTRHHKRRLIQRNFLNELSRILVDGAEFRFATDHDEYARWTLSAILEHKDFFWPAEFPDDWTIRPDDWPETRYEAFAKSSGVSSVYFVFNRLPR